MKNKKSQVTLEFLMTYGWAILVIMVAIGALAYFGVIYIPSVTNENYWCIGSDKNKCICEEWTHYCNKGFFDDFVVKLPYKNEKLHCDVDYDAYIVFYPEKIECTKYRKLTPQELLEKSCKEQPRDDEDCKCVEYKNSTEVIGTHGEDCKDITITRCTIKGLYNYNQELEIKGRYNAFGLNYCEVGYIDVKITSFRNITMITFKENITNCKLVYDYKQVCTSSILKTPCEKEEEDLVEIKEEKCIVSCLYNGTEIEDCCYQHKTT